MCDAAETENEDGRQELQQLLRWVYRNDSAEEFLLGGKTIHIFDAPLPSLQKINVAWPAHRRSTS